MRHKGIMGIILGICLTGLLLAGCGMPQGTPQKDERPVIKLGSDRYPPFNYFDEDGVPTAVCRRGSMWIWRQRLSAAWGIESKCITSTGRRRKTF